MKRIYNACIIAFSMFSKIPMPRCDWDKENMNYMMCFFPWVGGVIAILMYLWGTLAVNLPFHGWLYHVVLMLIPFFVTGGIHLDGFLDTTDALSSWMPREKRLEILKDVHVGAFAVLYGIVYFVLLFAAFSEVTVQSLPFVCLVFPFGRTLSAWSVVSFPKAKKDGTVAAFSKDAATKQVQIVLVFYFILLSVGMIIVSPVYACAVILTGIAVFIWYYKKAMKYFGGVTGDTAGYFLCICELCSLLILAVISLVL